ncbi:MAG: formylglycine-generating enzyme family protein [Chitinophagales bacterium]|nr:formylglycine-generating enzyme family protein [Chitinophagales bacterium]
MYRILIIISLCCSCKKQQGIVPVAENIEQKIVLVPTEVENKTKPIIGGSYTPLYGRDSNLLVVKDFYLDRNPVTQSDYLKFVSANPIWRKSQVKEIFADDNYLQEWTNDTTLSSNPNAPITNVSWFAAKAYCACQGKRLPTIDEWEYVAMADEGQKDARTSPSYNQRILDWYEQPKSFRNDIGLTPENFWGIQDMHGLVWEWTLDFNSVMISGESRKDGSTDNSLFCGSGSLGASDLMNYAAFMRYAFRGSLKAKYCVRNLGFRCAKNKEK